MRGARTGRGRRRSVSDGFAGARARGGRPRSRQIVIGPQGSEPQDGLRTVEGPASARAIHAVADEVATGTFDDAGGDGQAFAQSAVVVQELAIVTRYLAQSSTGFGLSRSGRDAWSAFACPWQGSRRSDR